MSVSLAATYGPRPTDDLEPRDLLKLEQEPWDRYIGVVSLIKIARYLKRVLYGEEGETEVDCGVGDDNVLITAICAFPLVPDLVYQLYTSYGSLGSRRVENIERDEIITVNLSRSARTKYPASVIHSYEWVGDCYDRNNRPTSHPGISTDGEDLQFTKEVYASVRVKYTAVRHVYLLTVAAREDALEDFFGAVVYGLYRGGISWLELSAPPNGDLLAEGAICGSIINVIPSEHPIQPEKADKFRKLNICSGEEMEVHYA